MSTLAVFLKAELLKTGRVRPAEFAREIGAHKDSIRFHTKPLITAGILKRIEERGQNGRLMEACVVADWDALAAWDVPGGDRDGYHWDGLMRAFGVGVRDIRGLPTRPHVLQNWESA